MRGFHIKHPRVTINTGSEVRTKQSHKSECDIHNILRQFQRTGILQHVNQARPSFEDLPDPVDFQQSLAILEQAEQAFAALPSKVRDHFRNSPQEFLAAFLDPAQADYLREVGLRHPLPAAAVLLSEMGTADPPA